MTMTKLETALAGTDVLTRVRHTAFYDYYQKQYAQTVAWLQRAIQAAALARDQQRKVDAAWCAEKRHLLAHLSGAKQLCSKAAHVEFSAAAGAATAYQVESELGQLYTGLMWEPTTTTSTVPLRGAVIVGGVELAVADALITQYLAQGLRVILPCLARPQHSFSEHPTRQTYFFTDDELLHLLFFVIGGSLAGMEAAELLTITPALTQHAGQTLPVALHLAGRHTLTALITAALAVGEDGTALQPYRVLVLPETTGLLDQQADDVRVNTIWEFHTHFDALTLFALAQSADLLFVENTPTPSACFSRALAWFSAPGEVAEPARYVERLVMPSSAILAPTVADWLAVSLPLEGEQPHVTIDIATFDALYQRAVERKVTYLEAQHTQARTQRQQRYALAASTPEQYRTRIAESVARVAGPALPATTNRRVRTRLCEQRPAYDLYEVVLESVPGVEVAGYLLLPTTGRPAPAIICQHGLGGRPDALVGFDDRFEGQSVYDRFAQRLAEKGYVVFVPFMNWGWPSVSSRDRLVKHAYALGFAPNQFEVAQLHAVVDFLQSRPEVIADRIAFYGLSYGGHASLWLSAHEPRLAAVVTAGHFNDWQTKLTSPELSPPLVRPTAYLTVDEGYDMFNYNVLNELGHAELATRFAPRPYFVENGLQDSVTPTAWVNREFACVQAVFDWLNAAQQVELEHFAGPHRIWAEHSFDFLHRHLRQ